MYLATPLFSLSVTSRKCSFFCKNRGKSRIWEYLIDLTLILFLVSAFSWITKVRLDFAKMGKMHYFVGKSHILFNTESNILFRTKYIWNIMIIQKCFWQFKNFFGNSKIFLVIQKCFWLQCRSVLKIYIFFKIFTLAIPKILFYYLSTFISNNTVRAWLQFQSFFLSIGRNSSDIFNTHITT